MEQTALVVPTIREDSLRRFIKEWGKVKLFDRVDLIVMEDQPRKTFDLVEVFKTAGVKQDDYKFRNGHHRHFCWQDIEEQLGDVARYPGARAFRAAPRGGRGDARVADLHIGAQVLRRQGEHEAGPRGAVSGRAR